MAEQPEASPGTPPLTHYTLPADAYKNLCNVRDELALFAAVSARRSAENPDVVIRRNMLAHCFEYLLQRLEDVVSVVGGVPTDNTSGTGSGRKLRKY
jgi:hypothetical protein